MADSTAPPPTPSPAPEHPPPEIQMDMTRVRGWQINLSCSTQGYVTAQAKYDSTVNTMVDFDAEFSERFDWQKQWGRAVKEATEIAVGRIGVKIEAIAEARRKKWKR